MDMVNVNSSNIQAIGYDDEEEVLAIEFHSGMLYHYSGVSQTTFEELRDASSVGRYFNTNIRGDYPYQKMS